MPRKPDPKPQPYPRQDGTTTYRVRIRVGGVQSTETFDSYAAAAAFCEMVKHDGAADAIQRRDEVDPRSTGYVPTLKEMLNKHVEELTGVDKRTRDDYLAVARRSWLPIIGGVRVSNIERAHVARVVNAMDGKVSPKTIKNSHSVLSAVLESAVRANYLPSNPARGTRLPRSGEDKVEEIRYLTYAEFDRLIACVPEHYLPMVILLFGTGLRFSEATALQVQDINPDFATLRVMRAWKREKGGLRIGPPKSSASRRTISIEGITLDAITPLLNRTGQEWLFLTTTGRPVMHSNFYNRIWAPACKAAELEPRPRIHDARHSHASWLINQGMRLEAVQERLGHEEFTTTRRTYAKLMPAMRVEAGLAAHLAFAKTSLARATIEPPRAE